MGNSSFKFHKVFNIIFYLYNTHTDIRVDMIYFLLRSNICKHAKIDPFIRIFK